MARQTSKAFVRAALLLALAVFLAAREAPAGQARVRIPQTLDAMKELMGSEYTYFDKDELLIVSDLDKKTFYQLVSLDFLIYMNVLKRDYFNGWPIGGNKNTSALLTIFLFQNRESYVKGLRKIGIDIAAEDENNQNAVRNGYFYYGKERNFILINYRDNYERGISTYAHELTHALMRKEFSNPPAWLNEGFATMVGSSRVVNSHLRYTSGSSLSRMKTALANGKMLPLSDLLQATNKDYGDRTSAHMQFYDAGEHFCRFLHSRHQLLPIYRDLRDNRKKRETDIEIIRRITGLNIESLEKAWHAWLLKQE